MKKRYFIVGRRPVIAEEESGVNTVFSFNWKTGLFEKDSSYHSRVYVGIRMDETEELAKEEFDTYVKQLREEI